jgi:pyruvate dehydrogenase E1 component beta subunit
MGFGTEIAETVVEQAFKYLDAPPERLGAKMCTLPFNLGLENAVVPQKDEIKAAVYRTLHR